MKVRGLDITREHRDVVRSANSLSPGLSRARPSGIAQRSRVVGQGFRVARLQLQV